ncbi:MAG: hypothetical protein V4439_03175 [Patescibacteria group bacterium]
MTTKIILVEGSRSYEKDFTLPIFLSKGDLVEFGLFSFTVDSVSFFPTREEFFITCVANKQFKTSNSESIKKILKKSGWICS